MIRKRILLIEDDHDLGATLSENLQLEGYYVDWAKDGRDGLRLALENTHDLILLDIMLPQKNGYEVLEEVRKSKSTPVFLLSAKSQAEDRIHGLELRADDYLTKPFHLKELFLRIENLLQRQANTNEASNEFMIGSTAVNLRNLCLKTKEGTEHLSETEAKTLLYFYNNRNQFLSRDDIINHVWGFNKHPNTRTVDNIVLKFRKILEPSPSEPIYFVSKRGLGYSLQLDKEEQ